jgi:hypothetical protein
LFSRVSAVGTEIDDYGGVLMGEVFSVSPFYIIDSISEVNSITIG